MVLTKHFLESRARKSPALFFALVILFFAGLLVPVAAQAEPAVADRLSFTQPEGGVARVEVTYSNPERICESKKRKTLRARYRGTLQIVQVGNGKLAVIDSLTFDEYLRGLSEVPRSWPEQSLKAQVIAARSYALYQLAHPRPQGRALGYDICSTDQCQVYRGVAIEQGAFGERWVDAVRDTAGQVLIGDGVPIQAFYFSTSSGRTRSNQEVFGGSPQPWFASVDGADADAPLARWTVTVPVEDARGILAADGIRIPAQVNSVRRDGDTLIVDGTPSSARVSVAAFRKALNSEGPCLYPGRYPQRRADGLKLPQTLPSQRFDIGLRDASIVINGRGWGHDVGLSQFGAKALAEKGRSAQDILAHYYGGLRPQTVTEPGVLRVLVADGGISIRLTPENGGALTTADGGTLGAGDAYEIVPGASKMSVRRVTAAGAQTTLEITGGAAARTSDRSTETVTQQISLSGPARVAVTVRRANTTVASIPDVSYERGPHTLTVPLRDQTGRRLSDGHYEIVYEAFDGIDRVRLVTTAQINPIPAPRAKGASPSGSPPVQMLAIAAAILLLLVGTGLLRAARRR